ncbi:MAG: 50S ribosomal protein L11 [archaeon]
MATAKINILVEAGKATAGPPLGPALAPMGVNPGQVVAQINSATKDFSGMRVPVTVAINTSDKSFSVTLGQPATSEFIKKELKLSLGAKGEAGKGQETVGNVTLNQLKELLEKKKDVLHFKSEKNALKQLVGTCVSMGITVEGMKGKEAIKALEEGKL